MDCGRYLECHPRSQPRLEFQMRTYPVKQEVDFVLDRIATLSIRR